MSSPVHLSFPFIREVLSSIKKGAAAASYICKYPQIESCEQLWQ
jgi:hypothetical protein